MITRRMERVNSEVKRSLNSIINYDLKDPRLEDAMITITKCEVTKDMKNCKTFLTVMPEDKEKEILKLIKNSENFIKKQLAQKVLLRNIPSINFVIDETEKYGAKIDKLLEQINNEKKDNGENDVW